jgi:hypothetical protein
VEDGAPQGQALLPPQGQEAVSWPSMVLEARHLQDPLPPGLEASPRDLVQAAEEADVLVHREVTVEGEPLGHVADAAADGLTLREDPVPSHPSLPGGRGSTPMSMRRVVVFPAPLGPRKPKISPSFTSKSARSTATKLPNFFVSPRLDPHGLPRGPPVSHGASRLRGPGGGRRPPGWGPSALHFCRSSPTLQPACQRLPVTPARPPPHSHT